jgi:hypothetical protein
MPIGRFKSRTSVRSAWKRAPLNRSRAKGETRRRTFARLHPFLLRSQLAALALSPELRRPSPPIPAFISAIIEEGSRPHRPPSDRSPIFCKAWGRTVSRLWRALTLRTSAPLLIPLNRPSRERKGSKRDHGVHLEQNARVLKSNSASLAIAHQGLRRLRETKVG